MCDYKNNVIISYLVALVFFFSNNTSIIGKKKSIPFCFALLDPALHHLTCLQLGDPKVS